jgi:hypothetical protein
MFMPNNVGEASKHRLTKEAMDAAKCFEGALVLKIVCSGVAQPVTLLVDYGSTLDARFIFVVLFSPPRVLYR